MLKTQKELIHLDGVLVMPLSGHREPIIIFKKFMGPLYLQEDLPGRKTPITTHDFRVFWQGKPWGNRFPRELSQELNELVNGLIKSREPTYPFNPIFWREYLIRDFKDFNLDDRPNYKYVR